MNAIKNLFIMALMAAPLFLTAQKTENRNPGAFNGLKVSGSFSTTVRQGDQPNVKIEAEGVETSAIITEIKNNTLHVYLEKGNYRNIKVNVLITYTELKALSNSGSGKLVCESPIQGNEFALSNSGSGGLNMKEGIKAEKVHMSISGSGSMHVANVDANDMNVSIAGSGGMHIDDGKAKDFNAEIAGSGGLHAFGVDTDEATISIAGSGGVEITVANSLMGNIAGSGNITYKGNPSNLSTHTAGSGRMRKG